MPSSPRYPPLPSSPRYGKHLTFDQVKELTRNDVAAADTIWWLTKCGATDVALSPSADVVHATLTVQQATVCLKGDFKRYRSAATGDSIVRTESYELPGTVARHVVAVRTWDECVAALTAGFPVTIASSQGFANRTDEAGVLSPSGTWMHQMSLVGIRFKENSPAGVRAVDAALILN